MSNESGRRLQAFSRAGMDQMSERYRGEGTNPAQGFLGRVGRRWPWVVTGTIFGLIAAGVAVQTLPPRYAASAEVFPGQEGVSASPDSLISAEVAQAAVARLALSADPEFGGADASDPDLVAALRARLNVSPGLRPGDAAITFVARDSALAAQGANTIVDLLVAARNATRAAASDARRKALAQTVANDEAKRAEAETKLEAARAAASLTADAGSTPGQDDNGDLNAKLAATRAAAVADAGKAALLRQLDREGRLAEAAPDAGGDALHSLLTQRGSVKAEIADASRTLLPLHPRMKELASELAGLDGELHAAADKAARASEADARREEDEAAGLAAKIAEQAKASASVARPAADGSLAALEAAARSARDDLAADRRAASEESARVASSDGAARVVARAEPPTAPIFPRARPILLAGAGAGFLLSLLLAALAAFFGRGRAPAPPTPMEERAVEAPAPLPPVERAPVSDMRPASPAVSPVGALATPEGLVAALRRLKPKGQLVVLVAGDRTGQALPSALEAARRLSADRAAVLIDLGETQPWLADILYREEGGEPAMVGFSDLVAKSAGFGEAIRRDLSSSLDVVLAGTEEESGAIDDALAAFAAAYRAVVLHASDWRNRLAREATPFADAVVVVAPAARVANALAAAEAELGDACPTFLALAVRADRKALEPVD
jgi:uncharacterized protein involved in exopolysaccharide biosynthesis